MHVCLTPLLLPDPAATAVLRRYICPFDYKKFAGYLLPAEERESPTEPPVQGEERGREGGSLEVPLQGEVGVGAETK